MTKPSKTAKRRPPAASSESEHADAQPQPRSIMTKPTAIDELMMFIEPSPDETRLPVLKMWDLARLIRPYAETSTGGFSGLTALRHVLECREAFERAWRLELMKRADAPFVVQDDIAIAVKPTEG